MAETDGQVTRHYRVAPAAGHEGCGHCGRGAMWAIVSGEGENLTEQAMTWENRELADDVCGLMNVAYDAGKGIPEPFSQPVPGPGAQCAKNAFCFLHDGHEGDCDDLPF